MATFVLVAGACCGGWSWNRVAPLLHAAGHDAFTPTLTGIGERVHLATPGVDLETHITDVVNLLVYEDLRDVTLIGYSTGGPITGVADRVPERLAQLIYGDANVPETASRSTTATGRAKTIAPPTRRRARRQARPGTGPSPWTTSGRRSPTRPIGRGSWRG